MLYVLYGKRSFTKRELKKVRDALLKKRPDALLLSYDDSSAEEVNIEELAGGRGLFESRYIVELDNMFAADVFKGSEKEVVEKMQGSENVFFVLEEKLPKKTFDLLKKHAEKTSEEKSEAKPKKDFSAFSLADALGARNKQQLWMLFREAVNRNYALEEIHGILFWQAKMIVLAHKTSSPEEAGMKPFPYKKASGFTRNYTLAESEDLLRSLTQALLEAREKNIPLEHTLERLILSLQ